MVAWLKSLNIVPIAYSPCGRVGAEYFATEESTKHPYVIELAEKYKKTPVQILLAWGLCREYCVIPKASSNGH
jgi:diketogulonate reductase-like aldo/keto reductase